MDAINLDKLALFIAEVTEICFFAIRLIDDRQRTGISLIIIWNASGIHLGLFTYLAIGYILFFTFCF